MNDAQFLNGQKARGNKGFASVSAAMEPLPYLQHFGVGYSDLSGLEIPQLDRVLQSAYEASDVCDSVRDQLGHLYPRIDAIGYCHSRTSSC